MHAHVKSMYRQLCAIALSLTAAGCATPTPWADKPAGADPGGSTALTLPIRLIADTQVHESRGTASRFMSLAGDEFVNVTIRTGQQVIGSGDLLRAALTPANAFPLTLHLGDAIDVSCQTEWTHFSRVMKGQLGAPGSNSWLLAPGNHDGFYVGNFFPVEQGMYTEGNWNNVCNAGRSKVGNRDDGPNLYNAMTKGAIVKAYAGDLLGTGVPILPSGRQCVDGNALCFAYAVGNDSWSSHIVQLVRLPRSNDAATEIYALLLDSSDYPSRPYIGLGDIKAGVTAGVSAAQSHAAIDLLRDLPAGARFFIAAHHPYGSWKAGKWAAPDRSAFDNLLADKRFMNLFVSAHTHEGGWYQHARNGGMLYELNLGSLSDAPLHYRTLSFARTGKGEITVHSARTLLGEKSGIDCSAIPLPTNGFRERDQRTMSDRIKKFPLVVRTVASLGPALWHFLAFWEAKHTELGPQLLAYADVVEYSMPSDQRFQYRWGDPGAREIAFPDRASLIARLKYLSNCHDKTSSSIQEKGHLLKALDDYYWNASTDAAVRDAGHQARYCMAARIVAETGKNRSAVDNALQRSVIESRTLPVQ